MSQVASGTLVAIKVNRGDETKNNSHAGRAHIWLPLAVEMDVESAVRVSVQK